MALVTGSIEFMRGAAYKKWNEATAVDGVQMHTIGQKRCPLIPNANGETSWNIVYENDTITDEIIINLKDGFTWRLKRYFFFRENSDEIIDMKPYNAEDVFVMFVRVVVWIFFNKILPS
jgi:hypothetical protein